MTELELPFGVYVPSELPGFHAFAIGWSRYYIGNVYTPVTFGVGNSYLVPKGKERDYQAYWSYLTSITATLEMISGADFDQLSKSPIPPFDLTLASKKLMYLSVDPPALSVNAVIDSIRACSAPTPALPASPQP